MTVAATCPECGEHLRAIGTYAVLGQMVTWLACDTCGLSWSEDALDAIDAERERAAGDADEPTVTVPKAEWDALVDALSVAEWLPPSRVASGHRRRIIDAARTLVEAVQR